MNHRSLPRLPPDFGKLGYPSALNQASLPSLLELVAQGARPREVAEHFGVSARTVRRWRHLLAFEWTEPAADSRRKRLPAMWRGELTMDQIGEELGVSRTTVRRWARALRLPARRPRRALSAETMVRVELVRMVKAGLGDHSVAAALGLAVASVAQYRRRAGWIYRSGVAVDPAMIARLFGLGRSDAEMAEELAISVITVRSHRHRLGLLRGPAHSSRL